MGIFFGDKTIAWFDIWSIEHFLAGLSTGYLCAFFLHRICGAEGEFSQEYMSENYKSYFPMILLVAFMWETIEFYLEAGYTNVEAITYWFQGVEFWGNRLITDPLLLLIGGIIGLKYIKLAIWSRIFSVIWLYFHIFEFPHSMYLHDILGI